MAVPAFIVTNTGQIISTTGLSLTFLRGIIGFTIAGAVVGNETFSNLADATSKYNYYLGLLVGIPSAPTFGSITPSSMAQGDDVGSPVPAIIAGTNFQPGAVVTIGGNVVSVFFVSIIQLNIELYRTGLTTGGSPYDVVITNPDLTTVTGAGAFAVT